MTRRNERGFTILELLVLIVFVGVLAFLVFNAFDDLQKEKRNEERRADIEALHGQLEIYNVQKNIYPLESQITNLQWVTENLPNLDTKALADPAAKSVFTIKNKPGKLVYAYEGIDCNELKAGEKDDPKVARGCKGYTLTATYEGSVDGESKFVKKSLEGQPQINEESQIKVDDNKKQ